MSAEANVKGADALGYKVWYNNYEPVNYLPYKYKYFFELEKRYWNAAYVYQMFNEHWHYSVYIAIVYVLGIHLLQRWMRNRKPYDLRVSLALWNGILAIFSTVGFFRIAEEFIYVFSERSFQDSVCLTIDPHSPAAIWALLFTLSKAAEFLDTVFVVLRKRSLIFLHWYHHAAVLVYCCHAACELTAPARYFMVMNYFVHSVMYTYYALSSLGIRLPRRLSMFVTTLQTAQMLVGVCISAFVAHLKWKSGNQLVCQQSYENLGLCFAIYFSFALLFMNFFRNSYFSSKKEKIAVSAHTKTNGIKND